MRREVSRSTRKAAFPSRCRICGDRNYKGDEIGFLEVPDLGWKPICLRCWSREHPEPEPEKPKTNKDYLEWSRKQLAKLDSETGQRSDDWRENARLGIPALIDTFSDYEAYVNFLRKRWESGKR